MPITKEQLASLPPASLAKAYERLRLVGMVLGQLALLEVITDPDSSDTAKTQAAKQLTSLIDDPNMVAEALADSPLAGKTATELKELIDKLKNEEIALEGLIEEE